VIVQFSESFTVILAITNKKFCNVSVNPFIAQQRPDITYIIYYTLSQNVCLILHREYNHKKPVVFIFNDHMSAYCNNILIYTA
jgi:hypothetical protein